MRRIGSHDLAYECLRDARLESLLDLIGNLYRKKSIVYVSCAPGNGKHYKEGSSSRINLSRGPPMGQMRSVNDSDISFPRALDSVRGHWLSALLLFYKD